MKKLLSAVVAASLAVASLPAQAGVHRDAHGNIGFDTLEECRAAIVSGNVKFYKSATHHPALLRKGEKSVTQGRLGDLSPEYRYGTCDLGTGHRAGRDGVAKALQGKFIPYSPDMTVNRYADANGRIVRVTMQQCDNWFSGNIPRSFPYNPAPAPVAAPAPAPAPMPAPAPAPVAPAVVAPVAPAPAVAAAQGSLLNWKALAALGVIGAGAAILLNDNDGTTGTTGTTR
ncbi:MAG: hypothetical protein Q4D05_05195 [Acinetobacter sp.]|nr:hypothetical protein [Acinetobacter sp.]